MCKRKFKDSSMWSLEREGGSGVGAAEEGPNGQERQEGPRVSWDPGQHFRGEGVGGRGMPQRREAGCSRAASPDTGSLRGTGPHTAWPGPPPQVREHGLHTGGPWQVPPRSYSRLRTALWLQITLPASCPAALGSLAPAGAGCCAVWALACLQSGEKVSKDVLKAEFWFW